jgi:sulfatase modifying factor 1
MRRWCWLGLVIAACGSSNDSGLPALTAQGSAGSGDDSTGGADDSGGATKADTIDDSGFGTSGGGSESTGGEDSTSETGEGESSGGPPQACGVVSVEGMCGHVSDCGDGTAFGGELCDGPPTEQCCVPAGPSCSVDGAPGVCMDVAGCNAPFVATPGLCPGDASIQCCTDPETACDPDALPRPNEGLEEEDWDDACPPGMVSVADFCIDRFEASLVELDAAGEVLGSWSPFHNPGSRRVRAVSLQGAIPQGYISGDQAADACAEAGKRLCDDDEWLRACQGSSGTTYPYGNAVQPGVCNDARDRHPVIEYYGTSADWIWSELGNACISQIPDSLDTTGENEGCVSEDGVFDMMGNVHEWTSDPSGTFRGGFYVDTVINNPGCLYRTTAHTTPHWDYSTGFRCCSL